MDLVVDWMHLPPELLEWIAKKLTIYSDYLHLRAVCHTWRSSVPKIPKHLPPQLPWLMLPQSRPSHRVFFNLSNSKTHVLNLPEASHRKRHCGSSHGCLVVLEETPDVVIVNPLTRAKFHLPPLSSFPEVVSFNFSDVGREYVLRSSSGDIYTRNLKQMRDSFIKKVILSSSPVQNDDFLALAIVDHSGNLAFCKNGDSCWALIDGAQSFCEDVVYHNGLFYAVNKHGEIAICDVSDASSPLVSVIDTTLPSNGDIQYIVYSGEELLLLSRYLDVGYDMAGESADVVYTTASFEVHRMDWNRPEWSRVESLGDLMLFIGENSSISLSASDFTGCLGGCIYFTDDYSESNYDGAFGRHDLGIFRLCDGTIDPLPCYSRDSYTRLSFPPPLWITPNPC